MKKLKVNVAEIADAMESSYDGEHHHYLDIETGKIILILDEVQSAIENDNQEKIDDFPDWEKDFVDETKQVLADTQGRYLEIPTLLPKDGYKQMEIFTEAVKNSSLKNLPLLYMVREPLEDLRMCWSNTLLKRSVGFHLKWTK
jgi:hypothetical protein